MHILLIYKLTTKVQGIQANQKYTRSQNNKIHQKISKIFQKWAPHPRTKTSQCPHCEN